MYSQASSTWKANPCARIFLRFMCVSVCVRYTRNPLDASFILVFRRVCAANPNVRDMSVRVSFQPGAPPPGILRDPITRS